MLWFSWKNKKGTPAVRGSLSKSGMLVQSPPHIRKVRAFLQDDVGKDKNTWGRLVYSAGAAVLVIFAFSGAVLLVLDQHERALAAATSDDTNDGKEEDTNGATTTTSSELEQTSFLEMPGTTSKQHFLTASDNKNSPGVDSPRLSFMDTPTRVPTITESDARNHDPMAAGRYE